MVESDVPSPAAAVASGRVGAGPSLSSSHNHLLVIDPDDLVFTSVRGGQTCSRTVRLTNPLTVPVSFTIRAGSPARYTLSPTQFHIGGGETALLEVRLRVSPSASALRLGSGSSRVGGGAAAGVKDVFHLRSEFFTQKFHATWYAWTSTPPPPRSTTTNDPRGGQVAHNLPDSTLAAFMAEGGAAGVRTQKVDEAAVAAKRERTEAKARKAALEAQEASERAAREALEAEQKRKAQAEADLFRPLERASVQAARQAAHHSALQPPSMASAAAATTSSTTTEPASSSAVSARDYLALSQKVRTLQSELDARQQEVQQWEFNYAHLEKEYRAVLEQVSSLHTAARAPPSAIEIQAHIDRALARERAAAESKDQKVLLVLRAKDAELASRHDLIQQHETTLSHQAFTIGQLEAELISRDARDKEERRRLAQTIEELQARLGGAKASSAADPRQ